MNRKLLIAFGIILVIILTWIILPIPFPLSFSNKMAFHDPVKISYEGEVLLYVCTADGDIPVSGENTIIMKTPVEKSSGRERTLLIYTPPGIMQNEIYPVLYLLHGFAARPTFWIENLVPAVDRAVICRELPPLIVVMPDGTLSGNGRDDPKTYVIAGSSMGGYGAAYYAVNYPDHFRNAGLFYPALDLRYAVGGNRLKAYRAERYEPVNRDNLLRILNKAPGAGILGLTDKWCYYPVFDSDFFKGEVWKKQLFLTDVITGMPLNRGVRILSAGWEIPLDDMKVPAYTSFEKESYSNLLTHIPHLEQRFCV